MAAAICRPIGAASITPSPIARIAASPSSKPPSEYLKKLYFDTVVFDERELKHLIEIWGADHIMLGTDYPFDMAEPDPVGLLCRVKGVSKEEMALVAGGNAARLLGLPARRRPERPRIALFADALLSG